MEYPVLDAKATGARIRELRIAHHFTVEEVARFMGFESEQAVYKWQRGDSLPSIDNLYALSILLDTPVDEILQGSREMNKEKLRERDEGPSLCLWKMTQYNSSYAAIFYKKIQVERTVNETKLY